MRFCQQRLGLASFIRRKFMHSVVECFDLRLTVKKFFTPPWHFQKTAAFKAKNFRVYLGNLMETTETRNIWNKICYLAHFIVTIIYNLYLSILWKYFRQKKLAISTKIKNIYLYKRVTCYLNNIYALF